MPCDSSYLEPTAFEKEMTKVLLLLDELDGYGPPDHRAFESGTDRRVYSKPMNRQEADRLVDNLCSRLKAITHLSDISDFSLEMQIWWREHQRNDKERIAREQQRRQDDEARKAALAKLTKREREILGWD